MKFISFFIVLFFLTSCVNYEKNIKKSEYHHTIAISLIKECDNPRALSHLLKAVELNPKDFIARHTLATTYYSMGKYNKALIELKKILKNKSDFTEARVLLARIYINLNKANQSLKEIKIAEKDITYPNYLKIIIQKGLAYYKKGYYRSAKKWFDEAFSLPKGKSCFVYLSLGKTELALENLKRAEELLNKSLFVCKNENKLRRAKEKACSEPNYEGHLVLAQLYIKKGDKKRAKYHLNLFLQKVKKGTKVKKAKKLLKKIS